MKYNLLSTILFASALLSGGCTDDEFRIPGLSGAEEGQSPLRLEVEAFTVVPESGTRASEPSDDPEPENDSERKISDFWLFQFDASGNLLSGTTPKYYSTGTLEEKTTLAYGDLNKDTPMTIYIVANIGDANWATDVDNFNTLAKVKAQTLSKPAAIKVTNPDGSFTETIPMSGQVDNVTATDNGLIVVPMKRMYAKLKIKVSFVNGIDIYSAAINNIPWYCRVGTMAENLDAANRNEPIAAEYPTGFEWYTESFDEKSAVVTDGNGDKWMVVYVPEVIRGEVADMTSKIVAGYENVENGMQGVPDNSLSVKLWAKYVNPEGYQQDNYYRVYPGGNQTNNFNIQRNCVYRVTIDVHNAEEQHNPSSNCFVVEPGETLAFEPYNRVETGGGFRIEDYLSPNDPYKKISGLKIIWQTKDCIGDNTDGSLVKLGPETENPINQKIYVRTNKEGNALVGAYNEKGEIVWSWHIWVTPNEPDNLGNAVTYRTYRWDSNGIYPNDARVPGYGVMPCNLGALAFTPSGTGSGINNVIPTYGMLYQWGRKDPFPPFIKETSNIYVDGWLEYTDDNTGYHFKNDNTNTVTKSSGSNNNESTLFHTVLGNSNKLGPEVVKYAIANPTVYISGATTFSRPSSWLGPDPDNASYFNNGDWLPENQSDDKLWGGLSPTDSQVAATGYTIDSRYNIHIYKNYGTKSIFDPCPIGWRVAPGELWLGFTDTGKNPDNGLNSVNYDSGSSGQYGMSMHMQDWINGRTSYFPTQGTITVNGDGYHTGHCGNYHNATCDLDNRVNILHIHYSGRYFHIFEYEYKNYYAKSTASPVRCVRDRK